MACHTFSNFLTHGFVGTAIFRLAPINLFIKRHVQKMYIINDNNND